MIEQDFRKLNFSVLGQGCEYEGDIKLKGDSIIDCKITGSITMLDDSKLIIERDAYIEGTIYCKDIEVFGELNGTVNASGSLTVRSSGKVSGKISAANLSVYPGAVLNIEGRAEAPPSN